MWAAITGAGRGLGRGLAEGFAKRGFSLVIHARDPKQLAETEAVCRSHGVNVHKVLGDLVDADLCAKLTEVCRSVGVEVLVNNAGIPCPGKSLDNLSEVEVADLLKVNFECPIKLASALWPKIKGSPKGCLININSMVGIEPKLNRSIYSAVRFGLRGFTEALALEVAGSQTRVFGVYPTRIRSRPEYEYGFEVSDVVQRIFEFYEKGAGPALVLDGRPGKKEK